MYFGDGKGRTDEYEYEFDDVSETLYLIERDEDGKINRKHPYSAHPLEFFNK